jgi:hypothetical protein
MEYGTNVPGGEKRFTSSIAMDIVLSIITCGIYGLFWTARQMKAVNHLLGWDKFSFVKWLLLSLVTCGIYHIFYEYSMAQSIVEVQEKAGRSMSSSLPVISVLLAIIGLHIVADAIQQDEINKLFGGR